MEPPLLSLVFRAALLTIILMAASLVFAEALLVSALILVTITLAAVTLVIGPDETKERVDNPNSSKAER
jgi:hypothetical protein